jgi:transposase
MNSGRMPSLRRARIVLLTAEGLGTNEIRRQTGKSKTCVWRWQERFMKEGFEGLLRDKTQPSRIPPLGAKVIGRCMQRHRHQEFIRFLNALDAGVPAKKAVHVILDNYATQNHPQVLAWLARHKRFTFHFTPTSCSWLNAVEGYFAKLSTRRLKRGALKSVAELQAAINRFLAETNNDPKPFVWTANPNKISAAVKRGHQVLDSIH